MRGVLRVLVTLIVIVVVAAAGLILWLWIAEYRPADEETVAATAGVKHDVVQVGETYHIVTLNVGYGGLGRDRDFFMDGGEDVMPESKDEVEQNLSGILSALYSQKADLVLLQEVDLSSKRSFHINEAEYFRAGLSMGKAFAYNFKVPFVPISHSVHREGGKRTAFAFKPEGGGGLARLAAQYPQLAHPAGQSQAGAACGTPAD